MSRLVQLQDFHERNGHLTEFAGFTLPLWFRGIIPESLAVRNAAGIFDVSHMGRAILRGKDAQRLLDNLTTNDVASLQNGQGHYSLMCNEEGGIKDDVMVFHLSDQEYFFVYNAGNRSKDFEWLEKHSGEFDVDIKDVSDEVAMFAVQGPKARSIVQKLSSADLLGITRFGCAWTDIAGRKALVSRTGYTGEDGFEIFVWNSTIDNPANANAVWVSILEAGKLQGVEPCGLGARDLLRLEAGMCLYGTDMDEETNPYEARLGFVVKLQKISNFIGKTKIQDVKEKGTARVRVGMVTERRVIPRHGFAIIRKGDRIGSVTSGSLSPILNAGIAMGYAKKEGVQEGGEVNIQIRERAELARIVKLPFYDTTRYGYLRKNQSA
jgi:aminomethyltransferase